MAEDNTPQMSRIEDFKTWQKENSKINPQSQGRKNRPYRPRGEYKIPTVEDVIGTHKDMIVAALDKASKNPEEPWLNSIGRPLPRIYGSVGGKGWLLPYPAMIMMLDADRNERDSSNVAPHWMMQSKDKNGNMRPGYGGLKDISPLPKSRGTYLINYWYPTYVNKYNPKDIVTAEDYKKMSKERQENYKGNRVRKVQSTFNAEQTTIIKSDKRLNELLESYGRSEMRGSEKRLDIIAKKDVQDFTKKISDNLVPIVPATDTDNGYRAESDSIFMKPKSTYASFNDYAQELMRNVAAATGSQDRYARQGLDRGNGVAPSPQTEAYEKLVQETTSAYQMMKLGLPAKISPENVKYISQWKEMLDNDPKIMDALEADMNNAATMMDKASRGNEIETASGLNKEFTEKMREKLKPQATIEEKAVLTDILAHGGMGVNPKNFRNEAQMKEFLEKFNLDYDNTRISTSLKAAVKEGIDPDLANYHLTEAANVADKVSTSVREYQGTGKWNAMETHYKISNELAEIPKSNERRFVVVKDDKTGIADVILEKGAQRDGNVKWHDQTTDTDVSRRFIMTPDEVLTADERKERGAKTEWNNDPGLSKSRIEAAMAKEGATYTRFFNSKGELSYRPDDAWFEGKKVAVMQSNGRDIDKLYDMDMTADVERAKRPDIRFISVQKSLDAEKGYKIRILPMQGFPFFMNLEKADQNRFFSPQVRGDKTARESIRKELGTKYYNLGMAEPSLKTDNIPTVSETLDTKKIFNTILQDHQDGTYSISTRIQGQHNVPTRDITALQYDGYKQAINKTAYKTALAANVYKDLVPEKEVVQEHKQEENEIQEVKTDINTRKSARQEINHEQYHEKQQNSAEEKKSEDEKKYQADQMRREKQKENTTDTNIETKVVFPAVATAASTLFIYRMSQEITPEIRGMRQGFAGQYDDGSKYGAVAFNEKVSYDECNRNELKPYSEVKVLEGHTLQRPYMGDKTISAHINSINDELKVNYTSIKTGSQPIERIVESSEFQKEWLGRPGVKDISEQIAEKEIREQDLNTDNEVVPEIEQPKGRSM